MKIINLRYPARCADCGTALAAGDPAVWYGRGKVYGRTCHGDTRPGRSSEDGLKWWGGRRVRASQCEDAPCCGCCGPSGDDSHYYEASGDR